MSKIYFIMWVAWSWKSTLINNLKKIKNLNIHIPLSYKTREIRETETNWVDAWFISSNEFYNKILNWEFLEYAKVHGVDYYWTKVSDVIDDWILKWKTVIKELDINGLLEIKSLHPNLDWKYITIFLNIPNDILISRINSRWAFMSSEELERRLSSAIIEEEKARELCDFIIDATLSEKEVLNKVLEIIKL